MRVLFTGLGSIGRRHLRLLRDHPRSFEVVAYRSGERPTATPTDVTAYDSLESALATKPSVAFVTNPTNRHVETAIECAHAGCHLFIEKPLSHSHSNLDTLQTLVEDNNLVSYVGCQLRFHPVLKRVQSILDEGDLGDVYSFRAYSGSYLPSWRPDRDYRETYSSSREHGGGVVLDLIHEIDYVHWLFGDIADTCSCVDQVSHLEIEAEDIAEISLTMSSGAVGNIHLDYIRQTPRRTLEVICRGGTIRADILDGTVEVETQDERRSETFNVCRDEVFRSQLEYFVSRASSGKQCHNNVAEAAKILNVALQIRGDDD